MARIQFGTDGDADRVGGMDRRGNYLSTHRLICLLLRHAAVNRQGRGRVVKTPATTSMLDKMCAAYGLELTETCVGFKHIGAEMIKGGVRKLLHTGVVLMERVP
jgi:phosphomannomutase